MLFPRTHAWSPLQKGFIIGAGIIGLICLGMLIYTYQRYYRGPSESAFLGVWETDGFYSDDPCDYIEFRPDQTFSVSWSPNMDEETSFIVGRWYAGGPNIYVVVKPDGSGKLYRPLVFPIIDLKPDEFRVSIRDDYIKAFRRVRLAPSRASNQAIEGTADRSSLYF